MNVLVNVEADLYQHLRKHLFRGRTEQAAFLFIERKNSARFDFAVRDFYPATKRDFAYQSEFYIELSDEARQRIIKRAWDTKTVLCEFHSHRRFYGVTAFSPSDVSGFGEFVPHIWWRLKGGPYLAFVLTDVAFDSLGWISNARLPDCAPKIVVGGVSTLEPTGETFANFDHRDRNSYE